MSLLTALDVIAGTEQRISADLERLASASRDAVDLDVSFQKVREAKPVSFFVFFPRSAPACWASVSFASWIALTEEPSTGALRARQSLTLPQLGTDQPHGFVGGTGANAIASRGAEKRYGWDRAVISHDRSSRFFRIRFNVQY